MNFELLRELLSPWGALRSQPAADWTGEFALPSVVAEFYERVGPWGEIRHAHHGPTGLQLDARLQVKLPPLCRLWDFQNGFRWNGNTGERIREWKEEWLLIADAEADPFILDIPSGQILFAHHGSGGWFPQTFAPDLVTAIGALATIANTQARLGSRDAFMDEQTLEIFPAAVSEVAQDLARYLNSTEQARKMLSVIEWG